MMINKRLIGAVPESKKYIAGNVALQWCSLCANIAMMSAVTALLAALFAGEVTQSKIVTTAVIALAAVAVRYGCTVGASRMGYLSSKAVKKTLRGARCHHGRNAAARGEDRLRARCSSSCWRRTFSSPCASSARFSIKSNGA